MKFKIITLLVSLCFLLPNSVCQAINYEIDVVNTPARKVEIKNLATGRLVNPSKFQKFAALSFDQDNALTIKGNKQYQNLALKINSPGSIALNNLKLTCLNIKAKNLTTINTKICKTTDFHVSNFQHKSGDLNLGSGTFHVQEWFETDINSRFYADRPKVLFGKINLMGTTHVGNLVIELKNSTDVFLGKIIGTGTTALTMKLGSQVNLQEILLYSQFTKFKSKTFFRYGQSPSPLPNLNVEALLKLEETRNYKNQHLFEVLARYPSEKLKHEKLKHEKFNYRYYLGSARIYTTAPIVNGRGLRGTYDTLKMPDMVCTHWIPLVPTENYQNPTVKTVFVNYTRKELHIYRMSGKPYGRARGFVSANDQQVGIVECNANWDKEKDLELFK